MRTVFEFAPQGEVLEAYHFDRSRVSLIMGPLGSGKTTQTCQKIFKLMCEQAPNAQGIRPTRWLAIRNTYADLLGTTAKDWLELFGSLGHFKQGTKEPPSHNLRFKLEDGTWVEAELIFMALDRDDHVRKLRGYQLTGVWLSETKELAKAVVDMADGRHGRYPSETSGGVRPTWHGMTGDYNAPDEDSWLYKLAEETKPEGWTFHRQAGGVIKQGSGWVENPKAENLRNLPDGYYARLLQGKSEDWIRVNLANEYGFVVDGKVVYPEYRDSYHCKPCKYDPRLPLHLGMDFGLTPAVTFMQRSAMGQVRILSELVATRLGAKNLAREIKLHLADHYAGCEFGSITGDPAGNAGSSIDEEKTVFTVLAAEGVIAKPAHSNDFTIRREAVAQLLTTSVDGEPALIIDPSCRKLRKGMAGGYCFKRVKVSGDRYHDKPDKGELSHIAEALQYGCMGLGIGREVLIRPQAHKMPHAAIANTDYPMF